MLKQAAAMTYRENPQFNCAEALLRGSNDVYRLNLDSDALATMSPFGGGMGVGSVCGALTGGLSALGVLMNGIDGMDKAKRYALAAEYYRRFQEKAGTDMCVKLREKMWDNQLRCEKPVALSAEILEEMVNEYLK